MTDVTETTAGERNQVRMLRFVKKFKQIEEEALLDTKDDARRLAEIFREAADSIEALEFDEEGKLIE